MALSIQYWANYTRNKPKLVRKSENSVQSDHVLRFVLDTENHHISSNIQASMRDRSYRVEIFLQVDLDEAYGVSHLSCDCPLGNYTCHHVAATLLFGYKRASKTDVKCRWIKNPKSLPKSVQDMETLFPVRKPNYSKTFTELKSAENQRKNLLWSAARKHRITASNFGAVLGAIKRNSFTASLQKRLLSAYNLEAVRSIWLHESGVLGASRDGIIKQQKVTALT
ncbi:uncharacterized protein LOC126827963 [Patella vulgata]|uniref:uncharacterized protein LOC126827963 n=1 Tax=Patella vulgata TaxID=6465 RepID=UPI0024A7E0A0|nr:uncharacterized protein LOC126827963 [Patella vulgata]